ncbi:MAG: hypothetical protein OEV49_08655 [candidate division Zixibacteria bacterium]|nr:hypothetical protein [candidate division Zixibacteria bacterium]MDH3936862.1 hypothetical protein [candidate division Zixibacteria bacterium]MDH4033705.1 hypothetical protein [candidate division Zixibacteria bacterium]
MRILPLATVVLIIAALIISSATSFPRLAVEQGAACGNCHINPNGGGMRNEYGNHAVGFNELCLPSTKRKLADKYRSPRLSEAVTIGLDSRHLIFDDGRVFRMQTDAFVNAEPIERFSYQLRFGEAGISENYALWRQADDRFYIKAGRFYPAYGLHSSDHKAFVQERTGHGSNVYLDGLSVGALVKGINFVAEAMDESGRGIYGAHLYRASGYGPVGYLVGASLRLPEESGGSTGRFPISRALFGGISYDRFTLMGELDLAGKANDTLITYANLTTRLEYGLYLIAEYNFFDGDRSLKSGVDEFMRVSIELYPLPFVQLRPSYTYYTRGIRQDEDDLFLQVHFGY